ncbi:testis anion transporter 1 isoform X1 [Apteryx rowi]|uniref:testis anion transporter 1 isoform X1 n=1 Tax=Apteryx rowi TaxID=308060 RepID=UPI000E1D07D2|nr:testis anion transporter 1 isoform X1 [Apteryx rowi]
MECEGMGVPMEDSCYVPAGSAKRSSLCGPQYMLLLGKVQKDHTQAVSCPESAFFISVQRVAFERHTRRLKCWDVSDSSRWRVFPVCLILETDFCFPGLLGVLLTRLPLPIINGFYSAFCCSMTYVVFGSSHHISIGSFSILNAMVANILKTLNFNQILSSNGSLANFSDPTFMKNYMEALTLTASTTFLTGIIQLLLGCFCLGFVTTYLPKTLVDAYLTAAALHVIVSQFTFIFGIMIDFHKGPLDIFYNLFHYFLVLPKANATSILLFLVCVVMLRVSKYIKITYKHSPIAFPMELLLIITVTSISNRIHLHAESSRVVVSMIPHRFLPPTPPDLSNLNKIVFHAFSLAIVSYFLLVFVGKRYASLHNYNIASNQELIAVVLCNISSSFFKSFAVSCALSGTVIQEKTGGKTQLAAAIGASIMLVFVLKLRYFFQAMPNGVLAAIVVVNMLPFLEKFLDIPTLWRQDKYHLVIWLVTFAAVLCLGLDVGLAISMGFTFFVITVRSHRMKMVVLGQIPNMNIYRSLSIYRAAMEIEGVKIFQCCSSISFANMKHFKNYLLSKMDMKAVPLDENEMRALISVSLSDTTVQGKDFRCACVCDPPGPAPRIPYTEKLVKRHHMGSDSSSSSVNLVHWSKYGDRPSSWTLLMGAAQAQSASPGLKTGLETEKSQDEGRGTCLSSASAIDNSSVLLHQEGEQKTCLLCPVHTIILDFSMVQFVDLQASDLLRQIFYMFHNIGITVLIASCHFSVIAIFEKNDFFDSRITKERFFLTLHDAVLAALEKHQRQDELEFANRPTEREFAEEASAEQQKERSLFLEKNKDFSSAKSSENGFLHDEPVSVISGSTQNEVEPSSPQQYDTPGLQLDLQHAGWEERWKYTSNP